MRSLIAREPTLVMEAEERGIEVDRDTLILEKRDYADSLRAFFAKHI